LVGATILYISCSVIFLGVFMLKLILIALLTLASLPARAADAATDAMQKAYAPFRLALFKTNMNLPADAQQALTQAQKAWAHVVARFGAKPPAPYDRDKTFADALAEVDKAYAQAALEVARKQLPQAHETLERVRDILSALRERNQVIVYSDHMNAYHAVMEQVLMQGPKMLSEANGPMQLALPVGALEYLAQKLRGAAPVEYATNPEFLSLVQAVDGSVQALKAALLAQNPTAAQEALGKLKPAYSKLFLKFG
jgi:hypothetical protein